MLMYKQCSSCGEFNRIFRCTCYVCYEITCSRCRIDVAEGPYKQPVSVCPRCHGNGSVYINQLLELEQLYVTTRHGIMSAWIKTQEKSNSSTPELPREPEYVSANYVPVAE